MIIYDINYNFYDNGIRNMVIGNFDLIELSTGKGALWENFSASERLKQIEYKQSLARTYFWRTRQQQEVDFVEEYGGKIFGFEFKWHKKKSQTLPKTFTSLLKLKNINYNFRIHLQSLSYKYAIISSG